MSDTSIPSSIHSTNARAVKSSRCVWNCVHGPANHGRCIEIAAQLVVRLTEPNSPTRNAACIRKI
uniref:Uncharacterized protein n=1 Tax=Anopheles dirus TaxID=7168 RepID=A0A182NWS4_9DIPT